MCCTLIPLGTTPQCCLQRIFVLFSAQLHTPVGVFQKQSVLPSWFCCFAQILLIWTSFLDFCTSTMGEYATELNVFFCLLVFMIGSLHRVFYLERRLGHHWSWPWSAQWNRAISVSGCCIQACVCTCTCAYALIYSKWKQIFLTVWLSS